MPDWAGSAKRCWFRSRRPQRMLFEQMRGNVLAEAVDPKQHCDAKSVRSRLIRHQIPVHELRKFPVGKPGLLIEIIIPLVI
jgi:hypothetical protein